MNGGGCWAESGSEGSGPRSRAFGKLSRHRLEVDRDFVGDRLVCFLARLILWAERDAVYGASDEFALFAVRAIGQQVAEVLPIGSHGGDVQSWNLRLN